MSKPRKGSMAWTVEAIHELQRKNEKLYRALKSAKATVCKAHGFPTIVETAIEEALKEYEKP